MSYIPAHLENTNQLVSRLKDLPPSTLIEYSYPCSLDVVSLFTSVPVQGVIDVVHKMINDHEYTYQDLVTDDICNLLHVVLNNNYFSFMDTKYKQVRGLAMGSSVSSILAIMYMHSLETKALDLLGNRIGFYGRYVDDTFILCRDADAANHINSHFNNIDSNIAFEIEHPNSVNELKVLDIAVKIEPSGVLHFDFYKKRQKKPLFVNCRSALPTKAKMHYIRNERNRIINNCSTQQSVRRHLAEFDSVLSLNDYPKHFLKNKQTAPRNTRTRPPNNKKFSYFEFPFISDTINNKITRYFRKEDLSVRLSHKSTSLRKHLAPKTKQPDACSKRHCYLDSTLCHQKNVVYSITCNKCKKEYIGSTIRELHLRVHEHYNTTSSSVFKHINSCGSSPDNMSIKILDRERKPGNLRIREALHISRLKPEINDKLESCIDLILF